MPVQYLPIATAIKSSYESDQHFSCLQNGESFMGVTAGGNIIPPKLFIKGTQWYVSLLRLIFYFTLNFILYLLEYVQYGF